MPSLWRGERCALQPVGGQTTARISMSCPRLARASQAPPKARCRLRGPTLLRGPLPRENRRGTN
eukprot:5796802-Pyramimonas_sp.AAC.1